MRISNDSNPNALRKPSSREIEQITKYIKKYSESKIKICKRMSTVFTVVGLLLMGAIGSGVNSASIFSIILGCICFLLVFKFIKSKTICVAEINAYSAGDFMIADGKVDKIEVNIDTPGYCNVWFVSNDEAINDGWFRIRQENVSIGSSMILTVKNNNKNNGTSVFAFTDFMLTDEGTNLHL